MFYFLIKLSTPTPKAVAIFDNVSMVGFGFVPDSTLTTVLSDKSASFERRSCEMPFACLIFLILFAIFDVKLLIDIVFVWIYHYNVYVNMYHLTLIYYNDNSKK